MSENRTELAVGAAVLAVAVAFLIYALSSIGGLAGGSGYPLTASFRSAQGLSPGTDVQLAGVNVGTLTGLSLNEETFRADAHMRIREGVQIPDDSSVIIASEGLLGGNYLEIQPGGSPYNFEPGAEIQNTQGALNLLDLLSRFVGNQSE